MPSNFCNRVFRAVLLRMPSFAFAPRASQSRSCAAAKSLALRMVALCPFEKASRMRWGMHSMTTACSLRS